MVLEGIILDCTTIRETIDSESLRCPYVGFEMESVSILKFPKQ